MKLETIKIGKDEFVVAVTEKDGKLVCQPWSFLGPAFTAKDLKEAAEKIAKREAS